MKVDFSNGVIIDLTWDKDIKAYRGHNVEDNYDIGIWKIETLIEMVAKPSKEVYLIK